MRLCDGGRGGGAEGVGFVVGGAGGPGGSIVLEAAQSRMDGALLPGSGGAGGDAVQNFVGSLPGHAPPTSVGGRGGDSGFVLLDGALAPEGSGPRATVAPSKRCATTKSGR